MGVCRERMRGMSLCGCPVLLEDACHLAWRVAGVYGYPFDGDTLPPLPQHFVVSCLGVASGFGAGAFTAGT
jgi:hypothetical protein